MDDRRHVGVSGPAEFVSGIGALLDDLGHPTRTCELVETFGDSVGVLIAYFSRSDTDQIRSVQALARTQSVDLVPIWLEFSTVYIGPCLCADTFGCFACIDARRMNANAHRRYYELARQQSLEHSDTLTPATLQLVMHIAVAKLRERLTARRSNDLLEFTALCTSDGTIRRVTAVPDPLCELCGELPSDTKETAVPALRRIVPTGQQPWRLRDLTSELDTLTERFVDDAAGIVTTLGTDVQSPLCATGAARHRMGDDGAEDWTAGLTYRFRTSQSIAIAETLERYAGLRPRGKLTQVRASYASLAEPKLDPRDLVLYDDAQYSDERFPCVRFDENLEMGWVWGYSFAREQPILVPEQAVYYDTFRYPAGTLFVAESSNGCATGACPEEAIFFGLLEVLERDAVLHAWHSFARPPGWDLTKNLDEDTQLAVARLQHHRSMELIAFDATQTFPIPCVWLVAKTDDPQKPCLFSASKCHPDVAVAIDGALSELVAAIHYHDREYNRRRPELLTMLDDWNRVREQFDHTLLAGAPEAFPHFAYLFEDIEFRPVSPLSETRFAHWAGDIGVACCGAVGEVLNEGFDVIVIDRTSVEQAAVGLNTFKVIVPGSVPFYVGHLMRRIERVPRFANIDGLNLFPHPFA